MKPTALLVCLLPFYLLAQDDDPKPETSINAGFNMTRGDQDTVLFELGGEIFRPWGDQSLNVSASYAYGQTETDEEDITTQDNSTARIRYEKKLKDPLFAFAEAETLQDQISAIEYRLTIGPGLGTELITKEDLVLAVEVGVVWLMEEVDEVSDDEAAFRLGQSFEWDISENASLTQSVNYLRELSDENGEIVTARITCESILTGNLSLRLDLRNRYESEPAEGKEKNNLTFTAGISVKL